MRSALVAVLICGSRLAAQPAFISGDGTPLSSEQAASKVVVGVLGDGMSTDEYQKAVASLRSSLFDAEPVTKRQRTFARHAADFALCIVPLPSVSYGAKYVGDSGAECVFDASDQADQAVHGAARDCGVPRAHVVIVKPTIEDDGGGCAHGDIMYVTPMVSRPIFPHELGHAFGALWDEYGISGSGANVTLGGNCASSADPAQLPAYWQVLAGQKPKTDETSALAGLIGIYEGCATYEADAFRPSSRCMMFGLNGDFCKVCGALLEAEFRNRVLAARAHASESDGSRFGVIDTRITAREHRFVRKWPIRTSAVDDRASATYSVVITARASDSAEIVIAVGRTFDPFHVREYDSESASELEQRFDADYAMVLLIVDEEQINDFMRRPGKGVQVSLIKTATAGRRMLPPIGKPLPVEFVGVREAAADLFSLFE